MRTTRGIIGMVAICTAVMSFTTDDKTWNVVTALLLLSGVAVYVIERHTGRNH